MNLELYNSLSSDEDIMKVNDNCRYFFGFPETNGFLSFQYTHSEPSNSQYLHGNNFLNIQFIKGMPDAIDENLDVVHYVEGNAVNLLANYDDHEYAVHFTLSLAADKSAIHVSAQNFSESETRFEGLLPQNILI